MRITISALVALFALVLLTPLVTLADDSDWLLKKYSVELSLGGGFIYMKDVNNFVGDDVFTTSPTGTKEDINLGTQFGVGFFYRQQKDFGWGFGFNAFSGGIFGLAAHKHKRFAMRPTDPQQSWSEQTVSGHELYFHPTWIFPWDNKELFLAVGPSFYTASLDRAVSFIPSGGGGANSAGSFTDAKGTSLGGNISLGVEFPMKDKLYFRAVLGGRYANIGTIYEETSDGQGGTLKKAVPRSVSSGSDLSVDFSGVYLQLAVRGYFQPDQSWRSSQ